MIERIPAPTGDVLFFDGGTQIGSVPLQPNGTASLTVRKAGQEQVVSLVRAAVDSIGGGSRSP